MTTNTKPPSEAELRDTLGSAYPIWTEIVNRVEATYAPVGRTWKISKGSFGRMCLLQRQKRTLLYLTPEKNKMWVAIVLGERAFQLAMASSLADAIKHLLREAKPYAEGRGIRFLLGSLDDVASVVKLLEAKTAIKEST